MPSTAGDVIPEICIAYDICVAGREPTAACLELDAATRNRLIKAMMAAKLLRKDKRGRWVTDTLCRRYEEYRRCIEDNLKKARDGRTWFSIVYACKSMFLL